MASGSPRAAVPRDLAGPRQQQIDLLQYLLGFGGPPGSNTGSPFNQTVDRVRRTPGGNPSNAFIQQGDNPLARLESFFGQLGMPPSGLQRQGADALGSMLNQPTPEQRALDIALPQLQAMLTGTGPEFERDLSLANQQGGRFGSANAILRGEALRNLYNLRNQTASTLGMLSGGAGAANRGLAQQGFDVGQQQAQQSDIETQRRLQLLLHLLGVQQQNVFNVPITQSPGLLDVVSGLASTAIGLGWNPLGRNRGPGTDATSTGNA